jgi:hypothetical protein
MLRCFLLEFTGPKKSRKKVEQRVKNTQAALTLQREVE